MKRNYNYPDGLQADVNLLGYIDFNGWTLKNLYISTANASKNIIFGSAAQTDYTIKNLNFENFLKRSTGRLFNKSNGYGTFYNCTFSGEFDNESASGYAYLTYNLTGLYDCSVNVYSSNNAGPLGLFYQGTIENCHIHIEGQVYCIYPWAATFYNSLITGSVTARNSSYAISNNYSSASYCVFDIAGDNTLKWTTANAICIYNSDKISKDSSSSAKLIGVTTEQMKNAEYLRSIGFPIGVD